MVDNASLLIALVSLIDAIPLPPPSPTGRGRPKVYSDRLFLKALVIMIVRHLSTVHALLAVLEQPTPEMRRLRSLLTEEGCYPPRRTFERRLNAIPTSLPAQIACLGRHLVDRIQPFADCGRAAALDSTILHARGGVWHKKHREAGEVPHTSIDTEAHWTKSGWHGWVYGWKLHLAAVVAAVWIPLAATLTPANRADNEEAPVLIRELPPQVRYVLGDVHYNDPEVRQLCDEQDQILITTRRGTYPHTDGGVEVRRIFHKLRSLAMENGVGMGLFSSPNTSSIMSAVPPQHRGAASGMLATLQNSGMLLSMAVFFTIVIVGLSSHLPTSLYGGLIHAGLPAGPARSVSHLPPTAALFATFLGYNPMGHLLPHGVITHLSLVTRTRLLGHGFFPNLIAPPFMDGLRDAFYVSAALAFVAAIASLMRGRQYFHEELAVAPPVALGDTSRPHTSQRLKPASDTQPSRRSAPTVQLIDGQGE